jgi:uncharacterized protein YigE (DUF2233 family)
MRANKSIRLLLACMLFACAGCAFDPHFVAKSVARSGAAFDTPLPFKIERFSLPGPVAGVVVRVDLADPRVRVQVALADDHDPDGDGPCVGQLDTTSSAARKHDFAVTINASFFSAPSDRKIQGKPVPYFVGNCATPVGWHYSGGKVVTRPTNPNIRDVIVVHDDGKISFHENANELPANTQYAVGGSAIVLRDSALVPHPKGTARHPRSAVGTTADGRTLLIVAVDGRQDHSRGVTLDELGQLMQTLGAHHALNLDGGGSTALVIKDFASGVFAVANSPSEVSPSAPGVHLERPIADVIGISLR